MLRQLPDYTHICILVGMASKCVRVLCGAPWHGRTSDIYIYIYIYVYRERERIITIIIIIIIIYIYIYMYTYIRNV